MRNTISTHGVDKIRPNGMARQLRLRVEPRDRAAFERAARLSNLSLSAWVRLAMREMATRQLALAGEKQPW